MSNLISKRQEQFQVCHFSFALDFSRGGVSNGLILTASQLTRYGITNQIISLGNTQKQIDRNARAIEDLNKSGVGVTLLKARFKNDYGIGKLRSIKISLKTMPVPNFIVLHQIYTLSTLLGYRYAKRNGIAYAVVPHGSLTHYHESDSKLIKVIAKKFIVSKILREADAIIVTCDSERDDLDISLQSKTYICHYGATISDKLGRLNSPAIKVGNGVRIMFSGRFDKKKNLPLLLKAMPKILMKYPDLILDIAGSGSAKEIRNLKKLVRTLELENNIAFHGWVDRTKMDGLFSSTRLLVLPSENENFALVVSEALSSGVPCVVSKFVGSGDIVTKHHAGAIIDELTPESVAAAVMKVLAGDANAYRDAAFKAAREDLDWSKIALKWKDLISSLTVE